MTSGDDQDLGAEGTVPCGPFQTSNGKVWFFRGRCASLQAAFALREYQDRVLDQPGGQKGDDGLARINFLGAIGSILGGISGAVRAGLGVASYTSKSSEGSESSSLELSFSNYSSYPLVTMAPFMSQGTGMNYDKALMLLNTHETDTAVWSKDIEFIHGDWVEKMLIIGPPPKGRLTIEFRIRFQRDSNRWKRIVWVDDQEFEFDSNGYIDGIYFEQTEGKVDDTLMKFLFVILPATSARGTHVASCYDLSKIY